MIEWNMVLAVIFVAAAVVGGAETVYQIYKLTARTDVLYSIPETIRFAKGVRVEI